MNVASRAVAQGALHAAHDAVGISSTQPARGRHVRRTLRTEFRDPGGTARDSALVLFVATQMVDIVWAVLALGGIEQVHIVPGITSANPLDLVYMPYTHSFVAALLWSR